MSTLKMTPELEKAVRDASSTEDITAAIQAELGRQSGAADAAAAATATAAATAAAAAATAAGDGTGGKSFERSETINGREFTFTAASEAELNQLIVNAYRVANAVGSGNQEESRANPAQEAADAAAVQAAAEAETGRQTELQLKFQRGEISIKEYLEQSGVVSDYLAAQGISIDAMKESVQKVQASEYEQSWQKATEIFLAGPGGEWPGGEANKLNLQNALVSLGLMDSEDKVGALVTAYEYMKQHNALIPYQPEVDADAQAAAQAAHAAAAQSAAATAATTQITPAAVAAAQTPEQIQALIDQAVQKALSDQAASVEAAKKPRGSSSMFGASSGVATATSGVGAAEAKTRADAAATAALKDASPAEILEAWKQSQVAGGKDPNTAFMEQFSARGRAQ